MFLKQSLKDPETSYDRIRIQSHNELELKHDYLKGWEFVHRFSERIARFLRKNERRSDSLKKTSDSLIRSFLVSDLSDSLMIAHFW